MNANTPIAVLRTALIQAKLAEDAAKSARLEGEQAILAHFPSDKLEGSITDADHGITVTYKVSRKVDTARLQADWEKLTKNEQAAFRWAADVDTKTFKALADLDSTSHSTVTAYITTTPNKPAITLKDIK
jgi:thioredoxin-like negative regulator of GroEL